MEKTPVGIVKDVGRAKRRKSLYVLLILWTLKE